MHSYTSNCLSAECHQICGWSDAQEVPGSQGEFIMHQQLKTQKIAVANSTTEESNACSTCYSKISKEEYWTNQIVAGIQSAQSIYREIKEAFKMQCNTIVKIYK